jgi:type II secretory pathway pseudopilin PulG
VVRKVERALQPAMATAMDSAERRSHERGFSLAETMISVGLLTTISLSVAQLFAVAANANLDARRQTATAILAAQKMEQLRGLAWGFDTTAGLGIPLSDTTTDLSADPPGAGGRGLNPSPPDSLAVSTPGYADYLDAHGQRVGSGSGPPPNTAYVRRWSIQPLPTDPDDTLVLQVMVTPVGRELAAVGSPRRRMPGETWLVSLKIRKGR